MTATTRQGGAHAAPVVHPAERVVAVLGECQGTGVLLTPHLVLTSLHLLSSGQLLSGQAQDRSLVVAHPRSSELVPCEVIWFNAEVDVALLLAERNVLSADQAARLGSIRLGELATESPLPNCEIIGFPDIQRYGAGGRLDLDQYLGTVLPLAGRVRGDLTCALDLPPATERGDGTSPLAGLSGSPLFAGPVLLGLVTEIPKGRNHQRVTAVAMERLLADQRFLDRFRRLCPYARRERVTDFHPQDLRYEPDYANAIGARYRKTEIFGLEELGRNESTWDLETAYLALEAETSDQARRRPLGPGPQRVNDLLADRPRILLRGEAGAGKTTLVWWLAAHSSAGTLGPELADLNNLVPFVVPLRGIRAQGRPFPKPAELPLAAELQVDNPPEGFARRVLESGRALLLVDGLDEVPRRDRTAAASWLSEVLHRFPDTRCIVTVRPLAVDENWLTDDGFDELRLLPMRDPDIREFVAAWHRAAVGSRDELAGLERDLNQQLARNLALRDLARTPLLCAVICALHHRNRGLLPDNRWALYRSALAMLLGSRDKQRQIGTPEDITLGVEEQQQLLQRIAVWLVRGGQTQLSHEDAIEQITLALKGMSRVRKSATPERLLIHLLNRSGLLQERSRDAIQFIHRTFQDYLAAKEFRESGSLNEMLQHAVDEEWQDVIRLVIGHCDRGQTRNIVEKLIAQGDTVDDHETQADLYVLAAHCAFESAYFEDLDDIEKRLGQLMPPKPMDTNRLVSLGPVVLPLLPGPEGLGKEEAARVVETAAGVAGREAMEIIRCFTVRKEFSVRRQLVMNWGKFPIREYARDVLSQISLQDMTLDVNNLEKLSQVRALGPLRGLSLRGSLPLAAVAKELTEARVRELSFINNQLVENFAFLARQQDLRRLQVKNCPRVTDLSALAALALRHLTLSIEHLPPTALDSISNIATLEQLVLEPLPHACRDALPRAHPGVKQLELSVQEPVRLDGLPEWSGLQLLRLGGPVNIFQALHVARELPELRQLRIELRRITDLALVQPLPRISALTLARVEDLHDLGQIAEKFPALRSLHLSPSVARSRLDPDEPLDLTPLADMTELKILIFMRRRAPIIGADLFGDRLRTVGSRIQRTLNQTAR
ncbi:NACHT domain-containing protein [Streptomyces sp. WMMC500]|uniref:NACHT domain-containing protein n=1 Tax=Streptomyces sp. WMMC500 TaxID=3015154 RepID=UPI00248BF0C6|nr:NACHT domain-containing protein [Streptomyces sp. WMMC500]WBB59179.1 NACHT domain-containing protein [Streptomyces sp. WMMC500]